MASRSLHAGAVAPVSDTTPKPTTAPRRKSIGLTIRRLFTVEGMHPYDEVAWETRSATIGNEKGEVVFQQNDVEMPKFWSQMATNVVVSKYFRGAIGTPERERSVKQLISRVADTIAAWGKAQGYFATDKDAKAFHAELTHLLLHQKAAFNSPVWFNVGIEKRPQCSACFILSVDDTMESILEWYKTEGMIFKYGSGSGVNVSPIRSGEERLAGGGTASGPVSFMRAADASAGVIKSGGKTRRAAKMVVLNADHPDVEKFITCKWREEDKAWKLIDAGYDQSLDGEAYSSVFFQNANNSVRATDEFMRQAMADGMWDLKAVRDGRTMRQVKAKDLLRLIAEATWHCGDPGMQFDTTINDWHTCSNTGRINASNPCSEYMHLDNSACNLASLNLLKFVDERGAFKIDEFTHAVEILTTAQDIIVDNSSYPTPKIGENARAFRELGLGYANLGALLMSEGLPYDSDEGRAYAAALTSLMCGTAYLTSARIARDHGGPYAGYAVNREPQLRVLGKHRDAAYEIEEGFVESSLLTAARQCWDEALAIAEEHGVRNSQVTVLAPTGTIGFMMDCDTTGVEPDIALIKYKKLVGGGLLKIINQTVPRALRKLGYNEKEVSDILQHIDKQETIEGAPHLKPEHLPVFDCAFRPMNGQRSIHYMGHLRMMGAVQPFISGAISKTVNLPNEATVDEIVNTYIEAWKLGIKAVAVYRDGSKRTQPLNTGKDGASSEKTPEGRPQRRHLPETRKAITHKFSIANHEGYVTVGMYEDGSPGEVFIVMSKEGSTLSGVMDSFATAVSLALQYGVPLQVLAHKFTHARFEPSGITSNKQIRFAKSVVDYIFRWLALQFLPAEEQPAPVTNGNGTTAATAMAEPTPATAGDGSRGMESTVALQADAPACHECGSLMIRSGNCYKCHNCGSTSGCS